MRTLFVAATITLVSACGQAQSDATPTFAVSAPAEDTRILAVLSYADWCGSCKALDPKIKSVQSSNRFEGVEFATLDFTNRDSDSYFSNADTLGIGAVMRTQFPNKIKTGKLYLIDLDAGVLVGTIDKNMDESAITQSIQAAASLS